MTNKYEKMIQDSVSRSFNKDDAFYAQDLVNSTLSRIFELEYPELGWLNGGLLDMSQEVDPGAASYSYLEMGGVGNAGIVSPNATDIPSIDLEGKLNVGAIATVACSFTYSTQDVRQAALQGRQGGFSFSIAERKARAAREAHDRVINGYLASGHGPSGLWGVTNHPGIFVENAGTGGWATATAVQIAQDFSDAYARMVGETHGVETPDTCVVSPLVYARLKGLTWDAGNSSNISVMEYLENAYEVKFSKEATMSTASAASGEAMMMYRKGMDKGFGVMPLLLDVLPPEREGLVFKVTLESRFGGVAIPKPLSYMRIDGI
jgi:hypothetical protein